LFSGYMQFVVGSWYEREEAAVICPICRHGKTKPGTATVTLTRGELTFVVKGVPAQVCGTCGEEYVEAETTERLLQAAEEAARAGVLVDVREYVAA